MTPVDQVQSSQDTAEAVPESDEGISVGGRIGVFLFLFFALAMITIELARFIATILR